MGVTPGFVNQLKERAHLYGWILSVAVSPPAYRAESPTTLGMT